MRIVTNSTKGTMDTAFYGKLGLQDKCTSSGLQVFQ